MRRISAPRLPASMDQERLQGWLNLSNANEAGERERERERERKRERWVWESAMWIWLFMAVKVESFLRHVCLCVHSRSAQ